MAGLTSTAFAPTREMLDVYTILLRSLCLETSPITDACDLCRSNGCELYHRIIRLQQNILLPWPVCAPCRPAAQGMELIDNSRISIEESTAYF